MPEVISFTSIVAILALVPFLLILTTSFTRISIVLTFLRQALSTTVPSSQIIIALSLILTGYIMYPVFEEISHKTAPFFPIKETTAVKDILTEAWPPLRTFMLSHTREKDLFLFLELGNVSMIQPIKAEQLPWYCVIPAFALSELRCAFLLGFLLFLPFLIIDLVISSLLMSLGMMMLPPAMISFPFKILLFVVVDGWKLVVQQVIAGYQ